MVLLSNGVLLVLEIGVAIFCFVDVLLADEGAARWLPRWAWAVAVLVFPVGGSLGWLAAGRSWRARVRREGRAAATAPGSDSGATAAPEAPSDRASSAGARDAEGASGRSPGRRRPRDEAIGRETADPSLLDALWDLNEEHEQTLQRWEADLVRREEALRLALRRTGQRRAQGPLGTTDAA